VTDTPDHLVWTSLRRFFGVILVVAIVCFTLGVSTGYHMVPVGARNIIKDLTADKDRLSAEKISLEKQTLELREQLDKDNKKLEAIIPSPNVYKIKPNESQIVPIGHLTVGLVGTPGNQSVELNINDKKYRAHAGDINDIAVTCRVEVVSFNVVDANVIVNASCTETHGSELRLTA
jgi:hypothetical protein